MNSLLEKKPLVSIIVRIKDEEKWITSCLNAIFDQDYKNFEVIIVDNNSSDFSLKRAKKFKVKIINFFYFPWRNFILKKNMSEFLHVVHPDLRVPYTALTRV